MDRPATGKRRVRSGSVHVTELIAKQPPVLDVPYDEPEPGETDVPEQHGAHRRTPSRVATAAKVAGLGVATVALVGAVAAATMITDRRADPHDAAAPRPVLQITGERALLPDVLNQAVAESSGHTQPVPQAPKPKSAAASVHHTTPPPRYDSPAPDQVPAQRTTEPTRETTSKKELVQEYYRLIQTSPGSAFDLLAGDLFGLNLGEFLGSWESVSDVDVLEVTERADGVLAVVVMRMPDGTQLLMRQLLTVATSGPQRIVDARILSAQQN